eukprot:TRINITY_DN8411_c0_g1_i1.p1 TRINITY_DN8411_c0_g1~~TRINITY_DN8411_c0_g1_i1.p1  ORF type:complete len:336 (+),score=55.34 TRINITY_DN8411_c0_g1_i1:45-1052(+)
MDHYYKVLLGEIGSGKSSVFNYCTNGWSPTSDQANSTTLNTMSRELRTGLVNGTNNIFLIDSPGYGDENLSVDEDFSNEQAKVNTLVGMVRNIFENTPKRVSEYIIVLKMQRMKDSDLNNLITLIQMINDRDHISFLYTFCKDPEYNLGWLKRELSNEKSVLYKVINNENLTPRHYFATFDQEYINHLELNERLDMNGEEQISWERDTCIENLADSTDLLCTLEYDHMIGVAERNQEDEIEDYVKNVVEDTITRVYETPWILQVLRWIPFVNMVAALVDIALAYGFKSKKPRYAKLVYETGKTMNEMLGNLIEEDSDDEKCPKGGTKPKKEKPEC